MPRFFRTFAIAGEWCVGRGQGEEGHFCAGTYPKSTLENGVRM